MSFPRIGLSGLMLAFALVFAGCGGSTESTQIPADPTAVDGTDAEGSFPDATADEISDMEEAAAAGESP